MAGGRRGWDVDWWGEPFKKNTVASTPFVPVASVIVPQPAPPPPHLQFSASIIGTTIPLAIGNVRLAGQIGWAEGVTASTSTLDSSFITFAAFYCEPIDKTEIVRINRMYANGTLFYDQDQGGMIIPSSMSTTQDAVDLRDCISSMAIYQGSETQEPDPTIIFDEGVENVPAFRGLRYVVFRNFPMFIAGNSVPNVSIEWERVDAATLYLDETIVAFGGCRDVEIEVVGPLHIPHAGFVCSSDETIIQNLTRHSKVFNYQVVDGDPIKVISRAVDDDLEIDLEVSQPDLVRHDTSPSIVFERINPADMPVGYDIHYTDPDQQFDTRTQPARYDGSGIATAIETAAIDYIMDATAVRAMAFETLFRLRSEALRLSFEIKDVEPEVGDIIRVSRQTGDTGLGDVFTTLVEDQTYTKNRTNAIVAMALLTSTGVTVAGDGGTGVAVGRLWPEDCVANIGVASGGKFWSSTSSDIYSVNVIPTPYRRLPRSKSFEVASGIVNAVCEDTAYVYFVTQTGQVIRFSKTYLPDYTLLETQDASPSSSPAQAIVEGGKLYFASRGSFGGVTANWITVVDLSNFTASGVSHHEFYDHATELLTPVGICIVGAYIAITTQGGSGGSSLLYGTVSSIGSPGTFLTKTTVGNDHALGFGISDGTYAYFVPNAFTGNEDNTLGARVTLGSGAPTIDYFDIAADTNVASMVGTQRSYPAIDGDNLCLLVKDVNGSPYIARIILGTTTSTTGISVVPYLPNSQEASTYSIWYLTFSDGFYYLPGNEYFIEINAAGFSGRYFPQPVWLAPANDNFASPQIITAPATIEGNNQQATKEAGEANWGATSNSHSVWYLFIPLATGEYTFTLEADFSAKLAIFTGSDLASLSIVASIQSPATPVKANLTEGVHYRITVDGKHTGSFVGGSFTFTLSDVTPAAVVHEVMSLDDTSDAPPGSTVFPSEAMAMADAASASTGYAAAVAESLALVDTVSSGTVAVDVAESITLADTASSAAVFDRSVSETAALADTSNGTNIGSVTAETLALADTSNATTGTARQASLASPAFGLIEINSGATARQTELPGVSVKEGT